MNPNDVSKILIQKYGIHCIDVEMRKNIYKVSSKEGDYCLKTVKYELPHLKFIMGAMNHLRNNKFNRVPEFIKTIDGSDYIDFENGYAYLIPWIKSRLSNYDNPYDLMKASSKLAELHVCSEGFCITSDMKPRNYWFKWINNFETRCDEILNFKERINQKAKKSEFDKIYEDMIESQLSIARQSIDELKNAGYMEYMIKEAMKLCFCHHDYAHHNVLIDTNGDVVVIDFDYCILDSHLHDLSSLLIRAMKDGNWSMNITETILDNYNKNNHVHEEEIPIMAAFMRFPQQFWQIGIQYYWEMQDWGEDFFIKKLDKYKEDIDERNSFIDEFMDYRYKER